MILRVKAPLCPAIFGDWYKLIEAYLVEAKLSISIAFDPWNETPTGNPFCESYTVLRQLMEAGLLKSKF